MSLRYEAGGSTRLVVAEYMAHPADEVADRIVAFYGAIRFLVSSYEDGHSIRVTPDVPGENIPAISYWRTGSSEKASRFTTYDPYGPAVPSEFARGIRYPVLQDSIEVPLELPTNEDVLTVYQMGGEVLRAHKFASPHEHPAGSGRMDLRFEDMLNMAVRITGPNVE